MKAVQSFWISEGDVSQPGTLRGGWVDARYHLMSWCLSALLLRKHFDQVELVCDEAGRHLLIDVLGLPYTSVRTDLEPLKSSFGKMWVLGKLHTYAGQDEPFLHVDGDAFLFSRPTDALLNAPLIAQNLEFDFPLYSECLQACQAQNIQLPLFIEDMFAQPVAANAGVVGGQDHQFFKLLFAEAQHFLALNADQIAGATDVHDLPIILEQAFYYGLSQQLGVPMAFLMPKPARKAIYTQMAGFVNVGNVDIPTTYVHMLGYYKQHLFYCKLMERWLLKLFPEYHERVIQFLQPSYTANHFSLGPPHDATLRPEAVLLDYTLQQAISNPFKRTQYALEHSGMQPAALGFQSVLTDESAPQVLATLHQAASNALDTRPYELLSDTLRYELNRYSYHKHRLERMDELRQQEQRRYAQFDRLFNRPFHRRLNDVIGLSSDQQPMYCAWDQFFLYTTNIRRKAGQHFHQPIIDYQTGYLQEFRHSDFSLYLIRLVAEQPCRLGDLLDAFVAGMGRPLSEVEVQNLRLKLDTRVREMYLNGDLTYQLATKKKPLILQPELLP